MAGSYTIGADTHRSFTEFAVVSPGGRVVSRDRCATTIPDIFGFLAKVRRPHVTIIEEGPLADWLWRSLGDRGESVVVCDPRRNHLIAKESDKDDAIDAEKLAKLYRGGYVKEVHHSESVERLALKRCVALYHDRVRHRIREANKLMALCRQVGVFLREREFADQDGWTRYRLELPPYSRVESDLVWGSHAVALRQVDCMRKRVIELARGQDMIRRFMALPGIGWIRASSIYAYLDTPFRFKKKQALWKYMGIGLERRVSGEGRERVRVPQKANRILKSSIIGAAMSVIRSKNSPFDNQYRRWIDAGISFRNARRNVARSLATVMWGMWKSGEAYRPDLVASQLVE